MSSGRVEASKQWSRSIHVTGAQSRLDPCHRPQIRVIRRKRRRAGAPAREEEMRALGELSPRSAPGSSSLPSGKSGGTSQESRRGRTPASSRALALSSSSSSSDKRSGRGGGGRWQGERRALALTLGHHSHGTLRRRFVPCVC